MCRLFGLCASPHRVQASFWLLEAPDSLEAQSHREPDGTGLGTFAVDGTPVVEKQPIAAYEDQAFAREARHRHSTTFVAHIRYASTGNLRVENTHPFQQHGRVFAHNGVIGDLSTLEAELGSYRDLVLGDTDSERFFALITKHIDENGGDVGAAITSAGGWIAAQLPIYAINLVLTTPTDLWALRYPDVHDLFVLPRPSDPAQPRRHLDHASRSGRVRVRSSALAQLPSVVVASERMDEDPGWRPLAAGELLHVDGQQRVTSEIALPDPPAHPLTIADLGGAAAASQTGT